MVDDPLEDEELRVARQEAAKNDPKPDPNQPGMMMRGAVQMRARRLMDHARSDEGHRRRPAPKERKKAPTPPKEKAVPKQ